MYITRRPAARRSTNRVTCDGHGRGSTPRAGAAPTDRFYFSVRRPRTASATSAPHSTINRTGHGRRRDPACPGHAHRCVYAALPHTAPPLRVLGVESLVGTWMQNGGRWYPSRGDLSKALSGHSVALTSAPQRMEPVPGDFPLERFQAGGVAGYGMVVVLTSYSPCPRATEQRPHDRRRFGMLLDALLHSGNACLSADGQDDVREGVLRVDHDQRAVIHAMDNPCGER